ncbi:DUF748 domain-containing protein [Winogradskyella sp. SYSU M77433]|uniref:DUF748 domain-containing protein n=1 Tax=Winogradskyella sp. SYSU M77433 TaxID=3042722 RepID=UPI002480A093|nr:DUF748 domain-containing protein [Winogradskyella sp. SYSU M77433]MDH7911827.1 DUF748 domain-containing protein [Winogradskyella sp. SYSU M77433]
MSSKPTKTKSIRKPYKKKRYTLPIIIIIILLGLRIYLPYYVKYEVNKVLAELPGYHGAVDDIDISLIRGAYVIKGMYLNKINAKTEVPFLKFPKSDISIEWKSLLKGKIVSEIVMDSPEVIYVFEDQQTEGEMPDVDDWTKALTDLVPIEINHFEVHNGKIAFVELQANPNIDLHFDKLELYADNLRNVTSMERTLPSPISATAVSIGNGNVKLDGNINLIKEIPDMNVEFALQKANVTALNPFTRHYTGIDFKSGTFELFSEVAIADGHLKGYMKPMVIDSKLISKDDGFLGVLWEGFVGFFKFILKNHKTNTLATKIPIEGNLNNVKSNTLTAVVNIFGNAWIKAFKGVIDDDIEFEDAFSNSEK